MTQRAFVPVSCLWTIVAAAATATAGPVTNLGIASLGDLWLSGDWLAFTTTELDQGEDLNGDGDLDDWFVQARDLSGGGVKNLAAPGGPGGIAGKRRVIRAVEQAAAVARDGDGDTEDSVYQVVALEQDRTLNLGLAAAPIGESSSSVASLGVEWLVLPVSERAQGKDLNGDLDLEDVVLHLHDLEASSTRNLELAAAVEGSTADHLIVSVLEAAQAQDLNGDGDLEDGILETMQVEGGRLERISPAGPVVDVASDWLVLSASESLDGRDLNGDGDLEDSIFHVHE